MDISVLAVVFGLTQPIADMPTIEVTPHVQVPAGLAQRASRFIDEYFRHLSSPDVLSKSSRTTRATSTTMERW